jgi:hypothetical protein
LQLDVAPSRRLRFSGFAAWTVAGGADGEAQPFFPLSRGPRVSALLVWSATPLDTLRFETSGSDTRYANGHRASVASFTAGWRTRASRSAELSLSVGPGVGRAQTGEQAAAITPYAVASADLRFAADTGAWVSIGAMLEPLGDPLTGELVERGGARASVTLGRPGGVTVSGRLSGSAALTSGAGGPSSPRAGDLYGQAELGVAIPIDTRSSVTAGGRAAFLSRPLLDQTPRQWVAFVSYAVRLPLSR